MPSNTRPNKNRTIELRSCFLPSDVERFHQTVPQQYVADFSLHIDAHVHEPLQEIVLNGLLKKHLIHENSNSVKKQKGRYRGIKLLGKPPIDILDIADDIRREVVENKLDKPVLKIMRTLLNINDNAYEFEYHAPSKGLVLVEINGKEIGQMKEADRDKLLQGDLSFSLPSTCYKTYKPQTVCVVGENEFISS